ncbi:hypothetical protein M4I32_00205 [Microbacterium sp. LRZ72]|uniref:hypothetical protein n=1 Tax=Microbacterium sp. LRZ72 TaxID=2942481 RepID=UPI0029AE356D|nr:hypothetical protein [Microbacterium sp. LRZ72]MDX2375225.1 hypothetical protein [Microbacterium sp. LRZ72]
MPAPSSPHPMPTTAHTTPHTPTTPPHSRPALAGAAVVLGSANLVIGVFAVLVTFGPLVPIGDPVSRLYLSLLLWPAMLGFLALSPLGLATGTVATWLGITTRSRSGLVLGIVSGTVPLAYWSATLWFTPELFAMLQRVAFWLGG